jgi:Ca-activated chloride channel family protein
MRFASVASFWLLLSLPLLAGFFAYAFAKKARTLRRFAQVDMLKRMTDGISRGRQVLKALLILAVALFAVLALARPQFGTKMELMKRKGLDVVVAVDVSLSMYAEDIKPNRMARSKQEIGKFVDRLAGDRVALVAFAGEAFLQCPLTTDYGAFKIFLDVLGPDLIETPGTDIAAALEASLKAFDPKDRKYRVVVLMTDGEDHSGRAEKVAEEAAKMGVAVYTVGIGSTSGVPIPLKDAQGGVAYKKDANGNVVTTRMDEVLLQKIALATNGKYYHAEPGRFELEDVLKEIGKMEKREMDSERFSQFEDRFQIPLGIALVLLVTEMIVSDRRKRKKAWEGRFT